MALNFDISGITDRIHEHTGNPKVFFLKISLILLIILTGSWHLKNSFIAQLEANRGEQMSSFASYLSNPDALAKLAQKTQIAPADLNRTGELYRSALENFVLHTPAWLGLTKVYNDQGNKALGVKALKFVHEFAGNTKDLAWDKILLADALDEESILTGNLLWLAGNHPEKRHDVFNLAARKWDSPEFILEKFGADHYIDILDIYIENNELAKTLATWKYLEQNKRNSPEGALKLVDYLISLNEFQLAAKIWKGNINTSGSLLYNGSFEKDITGSGFGWRMTDATSVSAQKGRYGAGLEIDFDGSENPVFELSQTVPLNRGKYILSGTYETDGLTSDQRPYWSITGIQCSGLNKTSDMLPASIQQIEFIVRFTVPDDCEAVKVSLVRDKSHHYYDNKISGSATINNLLIKQVDPPPAQGRTTINFSDLNIKP